MTFVTAHAEYVKDTTQRWPFIDKDLTFSVYLGFYFHTSTSKTYSMGFFPHSHSVAVVVRYEHICTLSQSPVPFLTTQFRGYTLLI